MFIEKRYLILLICLHSVNFPTSYEATFKKKNITFMTFNSYLVRAKCAGLRNIASVTETLVVYLVYLVFKFI